MKKRGISAIVATVLIVLITVAAVTIIWVSLMPMINQDIGSETRLSGSIVTSGGFTAWDNSTKRLSVQIERYADGKELIAIDFHFVVAGNTISKRVYQVPEENGKMTYQFSFNRVSRPEKIGASFIYLVGGKEIEEFIGEIDEISEGSVLDSTEIAYYIGGGDREYLGSATIFDVNSSRAFFVNEDIVPSAFPVGLSGAYSLEFENGSEKGKEVYASIRRDNYTHYSGVKKDFLTLTQNANIAVGDSFSIYRVKYFCGNDFCEQTESCSSCAEDCGRCDYANCTEDGECYSGHCVHGACWNAPTFCGDFFCDASENCSSCLLDCGECALGDGICENQTEGCQNSPADCGICSCGNGVCSGDENFDNCWEDCGYNPCGNGVCEAGETQQTCSEDCGEFYTTDIYNSFSDWTNYSGSYSTSPTTNDTGRKFIISPTIDASAGNEQAHHWITVNFTAPVGGKVRLILGHSPSNNTNDVMITYYRTNYEGYINPNQNYYVTSQYRSERYSWIILEKDDNVTLNSINHTYWIGYGTAYGHKAKTYKFANSYLPYRIMYPRNYDPSKSYPLVVSTPGSGTSGTNNLGQMGMVELGIYLFRDYRYQPEFDAFSVMPQYPLDSGNDSNVPLPYYPAGQRGSYIPFYHTVSPFKDGFFAEATVSLVRDMVDNPNMNVDENKIYFTGFSQGGGASYQMAMEAPDLWAAVWPVGSWAIGGPYSIHFLKNDSRFGNNPDLLSCEEMDAIDPASPCDTNELAKADQAIAKLEEEVQIYKNIPFMIGSGQLDGLSYGGELACDLIKEAGGTCTHYIYPRCDHVCSMGRSYGNITQVRWLFSQTKA